LKQIDNDGKYFFSDAIEIIANLNGFLLYQNYPNPFNPSTKIKFSLKEKSFIEIDFYNILGEKVLNTIKGEFNPGEHTTELNISEINSGVYFYRIISDKFYSDVKKLVVAK
jgi:hypothetical protein